ncbi:hypothetical protein MaudCBS49596_003599 [Microsporum audouinii]
MRFHLAISLFALTGLVLSAPDPRCETDTDCGGWQFCDRIQMCTDTLGAGSSCDTNSMCDSGWCDNKVCKETAIGQSCSTRDDCHGRQQFCSQETHTCLLSGRPEGTSCQVNEECAWKRCFNKKCQKEDGEFGTSCKKTEDCKSGLICAKDAFSSGNTFCRFNDKGIGSPCSKKEDCRLALLCKSGICEADDTTCIAPGLLCKADGDCCSKNCKWNFSSGLPLRSCA